MNKYRPDVAQLRFCALPGHATLYLTIWGRKFSIDEIIEVERNSLAYDVESGDDCFFYVWGMPGPSYNIYRFKDYGKTWAFCREDFIEDAANEADEN